jgi:hypothetical protein
LCKFDTVFNKNFTGFDGALLKNPINSTGATKETTGVVEKKLSIYTFK